MENWKEKKALRKGRPTSLASRGRASPNHSLHQLSGEEPEGVMATPETARDVNVGQVCMRMDVLKPALAIPYDGFHES